jgi:putative ABC transport system permease protein
VKWKEAEMSFLTYLGTLFGKRRKERDLDEELHAYLDLLTEQKIKQGMNPQEARRAAQIELGGVEQVKERVRQERLGTLFENLLQDLRFGLRMLRKNPGFTAVAVLTLALGIGATTSVFSIVDRALFRSLPYYESDRLMSVGVISPDTGGEVLLGSSYLELRDHPGPFESLAPFTPANNANCDLATEHPIRLSCARIGWAFLPTLGVRPLLGRNFSREEDLPNGPKVALISYGVWKGPLGGDPNAVGRTISLDGNPVTVLGVLPSDFEFPNLAHLDVFLPQAIDEAAARRTPLSTVVRVIGRLKPNITPAQATAALQPIFTYSLQDIPAGMLKDLRPSLRPLRDLQLGNTRLAFWVLLGAVTAVFLIACANVANLLLARATNRAEEFAIRASIGAGRARLIRQALTESGLLGLLGGMTGLAFAWALLHLFLSLAPQGIPRLGQATLDTRVLLLAFAASLGSAMLFGLASTPEKPGTPVGHQQTAGSRRTFLRSLFASAQVAISIALLSGAGLLLRTLWNMEKVPLGIQTDNVMTASVLLGKYRYGTPEKQYRFFEDLEERIQQIPGVTAVSLSDSLPPSGAGKARPFSYIKVEGRARTADDDDGTAGWRSVTPGYFTVLGIHIERGRAFEERDRDANQDVVILSSSMARRLFPNEDPLGKRVRFGSVTARSALLDPTGPWLTVVGVAQDVKNSGIVEEPALEFYVPRKRTADDAWDYSTIAIRSSLNPQVLAGWIQQDIASLDPTLPFTMETMKHHVDALEERPRFYAVLLSLFAGIGLLLAAVGIYGVISYVTSRRTYEIGIRMALGAQMTEILRMVIEEGMRLALMGTIIGTIGALMLTRFLSSLLFGVTPHDPLTFCAVIALLLGAALLACYIPARRATKVDPMVALRYE